MPTSDQRDAVRYDLDTDSSSMPDAEIDTLYTRAEAKYGTGTDASEAWVRVLATRKLKAGAAKRVDYKQNQSQEWLSQLLTNLTALEKQFIDDLNWALDASKGLVRFGALRRFQPRYQEYPDGFFADVSDDNDTTLSNEGDDITRLE